MYMFFFIYKHNVYKHYTGSGLEVILHVDKLPLYFLPTSPFIALSPFIILTEICQPPRLFRPPLLFQTREYIRNYFSTSNHVLPWVMEKSHMIMWHF